MQDLNQLVKNNENFVKEQLQEDGDYFKNLSQGQKPAYLVVGCSDSRVPPEVIFNARPGEFFTHRNIANQINVKDDNMMAVLEYALLSLKVENIIVLGHYGCGGVGAAYNKLTGGALERWIEPIKNMIDLNKESIVDISDEKNIMDKLSEMNVIQQVKNVITSDVFKKACEEGIYVKPLGFVFDISSGKAIQKELPYQQWIEEGILTKEVYNRIK